MEDCGTNAGMSLIHLVSAGEEHAEDWLAMRRESAVVRFNPMDDLDLGGVRTRLREASADLANHSKLKFCWMIESIDAGGENGKRERKTIVGTVSLAVNWRMRNAEIGYQVCESYCGRGNGTRAVRMLVEMAFSRSIGMNRLFAFIAKESVASRKLIERVGFVHEGILREHYRIEERFVTGEVCGLLRSDWLARCETDGK